MELTTVRGVCPHDCPDTCGFVTQVKDGKAISLKGDRDHPFTNGFLCQKVSKYLDRVYHQERLLYPMKRVGPKGKGDFQRISWAEAISTIGSKIRELAKEFGPESILPFSYSGTLGKIQGSSLDRRFFNLLGASLLDRTICSTAGAVGCDITLGTRAVVDPESIIHSRYIINWGSNTSVTNSHLWVLMHQAKKLGAKIVTIDPFQSRTAEKSDWWIPIRPGTDGALALSMMHIIFRENWQDQDYLEKYTLGYKELRDRVLHEYSPERVSTITGLPVSDIEKLTKEFALSQKRFNGPALIRLNYGIQRHGGGGMAVRNITCLPAITGDWRYPGGGALLSTSKMIPWNNMALERPDLIPAGTRKINMIQLADVLENLTNPPIKLLFVYSANPATVNPDQSRVIQGLMREDLFTVVHEQFITDTARFADIILPATTQLEQFDIHNGYGHLYIQANYPAIKPLGEAVPNTQLFRLLAREMNMSPELFEISDEELAQLALAAPEDSSTIYPPKNALDGITLDSLKQTGPMRIQVPVDYAPFAEGNFGTPSGKCEFYSSRIAEMGFDPLPMYLPPHEAPEAVRSSKRATSASESINSNSATIDRYQLQLITPPEPSFLNSTFVNMDALRQAAHEPKVEIHSYDAQKRNISNGDWIKIFNDRGCFYARALVREKIQKGVVASFGTWWSKYIPNGSNCNATTSTKPTDLGGGATFYDNLVEIEKTVIADE